MKTLKELYYSNDYSTDKGSVHHYIETYDKLFASFQDKEINVLEVGVAYGGSMFLWKEYFINANIYGYDIFDKIKTEFLNDKIFFILKDVKEITYDEFKLNPITIAIDDASHEINDQLCFIKTIYPQIVNGGLLIIEDVQDIDNQKIMFEELGYPFEIIDLRYISDRYDDVLLVYRK